MRVFVHLGYGFDAQKYRERYIAGLVPDVVPYGFHHAKAQGCDLAFSRGVPESALAHWHRRFWICALGFDLVHAWRNRKAAAAADIVWTMEEIEYLAAEDSADLRAAVLHCTDEQRRRLVEKTQACFQREDYSSAGMTSRYIRLSQQLLEWPVGRPTGHGNYPAPPSRQSL